VKKMPIVLSVVTTLACGQSHADPLVGDATGCDATKVDARKVVLWVLCHNQVDARQDRNESPYLIEVWLGYRSGRLYLAEQFHDGKISEEDFRTNLAFIGKQAFDEAERRRQAHSSLCPSVELDKAATIQSINVRSPLFSEHVNGVHEDFDSLLSNQTAQRKLPTMF
jgi:hypothetical protein